MDTKKCSKCGKTLSVDSFSIKNKVDGKRHSACKECSKAYSQNHYKENLAYYKEKAKRNSRKYRASARKYVNDIKAQNSCVSCGEDCPQCLCFHHKDPSTKMFTISEAVASGKSLKTIKTEVDKCVILCMNCHSKFHNGLIKLNGRKLKNKK